MNKFSKDLIESLTEACEHAEGKRSLVRFHVVEVPDVRAIRRQLRMSQQEFARLLPHPVITLKNWNRAAASPMPLPPPTSKSSPSARARRGKRWRIDGGARVLARTFALHDRDHRQLLVREPAGLHVAQYRDREQGRRPSGP